MTQEQMLERLDNERKKANGKWRTDRYWLGWTDAMRRARCIVDGTIDDEPVYSASIDNAVLVDDLIAEIPKGAFVKGKQKGLNVTTKFRVTNGDKIRNMGNEELAAYLWLESDRMSKEGWLDWLNREAT